jgi:hypothetical protein
MFGLEISARELHIREKDLNIIQLPELSMQLIQEEIRRDRLNLILLSGRK